MKFVILCLSVLCCIAQEESECAKELLQVVSSLPNMLNPEPSNYTQMFLYSGFKPNELGNYKKCEDLDNARYAVFLPNPAVALTLCAPKVCSKAELLKFVTTPEFNAQLTAQAFTTENIHFSKEEYNDCCSEFSTGAKWMIAFIAVMAFVALGATAYELYYKYWSLRSSELTVSLNESDSSAKSLEPSFLGKVLLCFSMYSNFLKLFDSRSAEKLGQTDTLDTLNGIRVMSIAWIVLGHVYFNYFSYTILSNLEEFTDSFKDFNKTIIYGAPYAVDTFFWLSGLLMAFLFLKEAHSRKINWVMVYLHRYIRITPMLLFCTLFYWSLQPNLGSGPMWFTQHEVTTDCDKYWWTNILYLNNFIPDGKASVCLAQAWYLANDMQFFLVSPVILAVYIKWPLIGWSLIGGLVSTAIISSAAIADHFNMKAALLGNTPDEYNYYYVKPYCRVGPYALGLAVGVLVFNYRTHTEIRHARDQYALAVCNAMKNVVVRLTAVTVGLFFVLFFVFYQYDTYKHPGSNNKYDSWGESGNVAFMAFMRVGFGLGLSLFFVPVLLGYLKPVAWFLGASVWTPFARLTFAIYLLHYNIIFTVFKSQHTQLYYDEFYLVRDGVFFFLFSAVVSIGAVLLIEFPCMNLERLVLRPSTPQPKLITKT